MTHEYSFKYSIIKFSAAVDILRGLLIKRKLGLNGEPYIKKFSYIRYIIKIPQLTAAVITSRRYYNKKKRIILIRITERNIGGIKLKVHRTKF